VAPLESRLSTLGWAVKFADCKATHKQLQDSKGEVSLDHLLTPALQPSGLQQLKTDLPRELALLDLESSLPKLSTLPATGDEYGSFYVVLRTYLIICYRNDVFSSRASIDSIFHSNKGNISDSVDVLLAGFNDGIVDVRIFDCFDIGSINIADSVAPAKNCNILYHASHPLTSTDSMVVALESAKNEELRLVTLDLRFISSSSRYLALLASKSTQLQNLLRYIKQVQAHIVQEWTTSQDLPAKYMRNINEELTDKHSCDFVTAAYHLLVTGDCYETMKAFLVDQVGERVSWRCLAGWGDML
jgi:anaphase-promoting complex subunit 4